MSRLSVGQEVYFRAQLMVKCSNSGSAWLSLLVIPCGCIGGTSIVLPDARNLHPTKAGLQNFLFVEVPGLTVDPCSRALYAAAHGRSIWRMFLPPATVA